MGKWEGCNMLEEVGESGIKILLYLRKGEAILSDFKKDIGMGYQAVYHAVATLLKYDLIREKDVKGNVRCFELSPLGKKVSEKIYEAEQILTEAKRKP